MPSYTYLPNNSFFIKNSFILTKSVQHGVNTTIACIHYQMQLDDYTLCLTLPKVGEDTLVC